MLAFPGHLRWRPGRRCPAHHSARKFAPAYAIAELAAKDLSADYIVPSPLDPRLPRHPPRPSRPRWRRSSLHPPRKLQRRCLPCGKHRRREVLSTLARQDVGRGGCVIKGLEALFDLMGAKPSCVFSSVSAFKAVHDVLVEHFACRGFEHVLF